VYMCDFTGRIPNDPIVIVLFCNIKTVINFVKKTCKTDNKVKFLPAFVVSVRIKLV
jgi:hypothetical protein